MTTALIVDPSALVTETDAARFLSVSIRTLQAWRVRGLGPPFVRVGRAIRYQRNALIAWTNANTVTPRRSSPHK